MLTIENVARMTREDRRTGLARARLINLHARQNVGDAALVEATGTVLRDLWPGLELEAATRYRDDDEWLRSLGMTPKAPAVPFPPPGDGSDPSRAIRFGVGLLRARLERARLAPAEGEIVLSAAGGYLFSRGRRNLTLRHVLAEIETAAARSPTVLLPQSIGPVADERDRRRFARALQNVVKVLVRERLSRELVVERLGVPEAKVAVIPDLAFAYGPATAVPRQATQAPRAAFTVLDWRWAGGGDYERYLSALAQVIQALLDDGMEVDLIVHVDLAGHAGQDDRGATERVRERLAAPDRVALRSAGNRPADAVETYGGYDVVFGSRLHSCLLALCAGVPAIALGYQPKAAGIYADLGLG